MGKIAAMVLVRDEADDIGWWIAYHLSIGVQTVIVYDDYSSDGTWALLQAAQLMGDVRVHRTDAGLAGDERVAAARGEAVARYRQEFDWIGFFAVDEYVTLDRGVELSKVLEQPEDIAAVALSWCVHGSNARVVKPRVSPLVAYPLHASADFQPHFHYSAFYRPAMLPEGALSGERLGLTREQVASASGEPAVWHGELVQPNWYRARVRKYACRSMAHYLERIRNDVAVADGVWWRHLDQNVEYSDLPALPRTMEEKVFALYRALWNRIVLRSQLTSALRPGAVPDGGEGALSGAVAYELRGSDGHVLCYDRRTHHLRGVWPEVLEQTPTLRKVIAFRWPDLPDWTVLVQEVGPGEDGSFHLGEHGLLLDRMPMRTVGYDAHTVALQSPFLHRYMSIVPMDGTVPIDRQSVQGWEQFRLRPALVSAETVEKVAGIGALARGGLQADAVLTLLPYVTIEQGASLATVFAMLPVADQRRLVAEFPGCFPQWLRGYDV